MTPTNLTTEDLARILYEAMNTLWTWDEESPAERKRHRKGVKAILKALANEEDCDKNKD